MLNMFEDMWCRRINVNDGINFEVHEYKYIVSS